MTKTEKDDKGAQFKSITPYHGKLNVTNHAGRYDLDVFSYGNFIKTITLDTSGEIIA